MTRCNEFYEKWAREPNFCNKHKSTVSLINSYMKLVEALEAEGVDHETAYAKVPEGAARHIFSYDKERYDARVKAIAQSIKEGASDEDIDVCIQLGPEHVADQRGYRAIRAKDKETPAKPKSGFEQVLDGMKKELDSGTYIWHVSAAHEKVLKLTKAEINKMTPDDKAQAMDRLKSMAAHIQSLMDSQMTVVEDCGCEVVDAEFAFVNPAPEKTVEQAYSEKQNAVMFAIEEAAKLHMENLHFRELGGKRSDTGEASGIVKQQKAHDAVVKVLNLVHGEGKWSITERKAMEKRVAAASGAMWKRFQKVKPVKVKKGEKLTPIQSAAFSAALHKELSEEIDLLPKEQLTEALNDDYRIHEDTYLDAVDKVAALMFPDKKEENITDADMDEVDALIDSFYPKAMEHIKKYGLGVKKE